MHAAFMHIGSVKYVSCHWVSQATVIPCICGLLQGFVFSPYIREFSFYFHSQVIFTFNDFTALNM